ncbi:hypothetical protein GOP47_0020196 [Adiantum capillus-veneris]|uniref:Pentatricopeptide repeat-containing protein n=1 Tax=Adiantum capillus-veneris TaxID=13818 RepID=A0A9D4ZAD5_ADICA|nr:hypothetical protein GOP47_0020196 [Adiantum capillus-veneris]
MARSLANGHSRCSAGHQSLPFRKSAFREEHIGQDGHEIRQLCEEGDLQKAFAALSLMDREGTVPPEPVYYSLLKACNKRKSLDHARRVQAHLVHHRLELTGFFGEYLVVTLAKCGAIDESFEAFHRLHYQTVFSWTAIISAYSSCGKGPEALGMYKEMRRKGVGPDEVTISSVLKACSTIPDLDEGRIIFADAVKYGFDLDLHVGNTLLSLYGKCGYSLEAEFVFSRLFVCNTISWNTMLSTYVEHGSGEKALLLFRQMQAEHVKPDQRTFVITLQACCVLTKEDTFSTESRSVLADFGWALHADLSKHGLAPDIFINNTLISLYAKCEHLREACHLFCEMLECNTESWNEVLAAHVEKGSCAKALQLYRLMHSEGVCANQWTFVLVLQACWTLAAQESYPSIGELGTKLLPWLDIGEALHADAEVKNLTSNLFVGNSLVKMYGKCRKVKEAEKVFALLSKRDIVSWNSMLSTYVDHVGCEDKALELYLQMEARGQAPDDITFGSLLRACSGRGSSDLCRVVHYMAISSGLDGIPLLLNTLIHAYGCCASMEDAQATFYRLPKHGIVSWNALIAGYALNGDGKRSMESFQKMQEACIIPDGITFISLFFACSHAGFVDKAVEFLDYMGNQGIVLDRKHFGSLVDLLGRAGDFKSLESILWKMPLHPDATLWSSLLGACQMHNNLKLAREAFTTASFEQPEETNTYVMMGNIYAKDGLHNG